VSSIFFDATHYPEEAAALRAIPQGSLINVFGIDLTAPADGLAALIAARRAGRATALLPILPDPYESTLATIFQTIGAVPDLEQRMVQLAALRSDQLLVNGKKPAEFATYPQAHLDAAMLALRLADMILLAAPGERDRWAHLLKRPIRRFGMLPVASEDGGAPGLDTPGVAIYAPSTPATQIAPYTWMLRCRRIEPQVVCAENAGDPISARIVVLPEWRPMRARSLAAHGHVVVTPNVSRVDECDPRIVGYVANDFLSLYAAIDAAIALPDAGPQKNGMEAIASLTQAIAQQAATKLDGERISVIVRTYNRPELLRRAVASVAAQTYGNVEVVVVNNGGDDVRSIVEAAAAGRPYRYETLSERGHISAASNAGARAATGTYIGYLDDDDLLYADHCARAIEVLERSEADVVFTTCLGEYAEVNAGAKRVIGYNIYLDRDFDPDEMHVTNVSPIHTIVHRATLFDRFGFFDETLSVTDDWELWLRVSSQGGRFVRIDRVTCEYSWRYDPLLGNMTIDHQWDFVQAYRTIVQRYAPHTSGRTRILQAQALMLAEQERRAFVAADPRQRAEAVIGAMSNAVVPVAPIHEELHA
jgi:hypothetical protein